MLQPFPNTPIRNAFSQKKTLFIPFIMAGHPSLNTTTKALLALAEKGADIIELGIPFSDPIADGPVNQKAAEIALQNGATLNWCLEQVKAVRELGCQTPLVLFSYFNPILAMGIEVFAKKAKAAGVNGILIVDLPPEEGKTIYETLTGYQIEPILLVSPTTDLKRLSLYKALHPAFIYYISRLGVTGVQNTLSSTLQDEIHALKEVLPDIPLAVGFGIATIHQAQEVARMAQGVIVGSLLVNTLEQSGMAEFSLLANDLAKTVANYE